MFNEILLFVKHPYAAGIIAVQWIASTVLIAMDGQLPIVRIVMVNMLASFVIALIGFRSSR